MEDILKELRKYNNVELNNLQDQILLIINKNRRDEIEFNVTKLLKKISKEDLERCHYLMDKMENVYNIEHEIVFKKKVRFCVNYGVKFSINHDVKNEIDYRELDRVRTIIFEENKVYNNELIEICKKYKDFDAAQDVLDYLKLYRKIAEKNIKEIIE
jgi:hypothetical protein